LAKIHKIDPILFLKFYKKNSVSTLWSRSPPKNKSGFVNCRYKAKTFAYMWVHMCTYCSKEKLSQNIYENLHFYHSTFFTTCRIYTLQNYHEWLIWHRMGICNVIWSTSTNMSSIS